MKERKAYVVTKYWKKREAAESGLNLSYHFTLKEARRAVREYLKVKRIHPSHRWTGEGTVEGYSKYPYDSLGGGYVIKRTTIWDYGYNGF